jgi:hypothetical protein
MLISRLLTRSTTVIALACGLLLGSPYGRSALSSGLQNASNGSNCEEERTVNSRLRSLMGNLNDRLINQAAITIWLNANPRALEILWQEYVDNLINVAGVKREDAIRTANVSVEYGALNAKIILRARGRPVESLLLDGAGFYNNWQAEHGANSAYEERKLY